MEHTERVKIAETTLPQDHRWTGLLAVEGAYG